MKFRLFATILAVLAGAKSGLAQATFPPETDNAAALRYWFALAEVREPPDDVPTQHLLEETFAGHVAWDETKLGPITDSNLDAIRTMQQATMLPECNWGFDYRHGATMPIWYGMRARLLSHLNELQGMREMAHGDPGAAVHTWLAGIHFAQDVARSGPTIVALIAHVMLLDNLQPLRNSAQQGKLNEEQKKQWFDWGVPWGVEYAVGHQFLQKLQTASNPRSVYERAGMAVPQGVPPTKQEIERYDEYMLAAQAALREPPTKAKTLLQELEQKRLTLGEVEQNLIPNAQGVNSARTEVRTAIAELRQAVAS